MLINVWKLTKELQEAGIPIDGCADDGRIDFRDGATSAQRENAAQILAAHDPTETPAPFISFGLPLIAPKITVSEIIVQSPKPKDKAVDALSHLVGLAKGKDKPLAEILLNLVVYIDDLEKRLGKKNI